MAKVISGHFRKKDILLKLMINRKQQVQIKKMKSTAYLINVSRGGIVQEQDLAEALSSGLLSGGILSPTLLPDSVE